MPERRDLYFVTPTERRLIELYVTEKEAWDAIRKFLRARNFKSYYTRVWDPEPGVRRRYDVGSHTEFFDWVEPTEGLKGEKNE